MRNFHERYPGDSREPRVSLALWQGDGVEYLHETEFVGKFEELRSRLWEPQRLRPLDQYDLEWALLFDTAFEAVGLDAAMTFAPGAFCAVAARLAAKEPEVVLHANWTSRCFRFLLRGDQVEVQTARCSWKTGAIVIEEACRRFACNWRDLVLEFVALDLRERRFRAAIGEPNVRVIPRLAYNELLTTVVDVVGADWLTVLHDRGISELLADRR